MILLPASVALVAPLLLQGGAPGAFPRDWVVKEVLPPEWIVSTSIVADNATFLGNSLGDGVGYWGWNEWGTTYQHVNHLSRGLVLDSAKTLTTAFGTMPASVSPGNAVMLSSPGGPLYCSPSSLWSWRSAVWNLSPPSLNGVLPSGRSPDHTLRAGDLDGDGTEDYFYTAFDVLTSTHVVGAVSVASMTPLWESPSPAGGLSSLNLYVELGPPPDIDGDGVPDLVTGWHVPNFSLSVYEQYLEAYSGADGSLIWSNNLGSQGPGYVATTTHGPDFTGDGVGDAVFAGGDTVRAVHGVTGTAIWTAPPSALLPHLPPGTSSPSPGDGAMITGRAGEPGTWEIMTTVWALNATPGTHFFHFDAMTGQILHVDALADTLEPWAPDSIQGPGTIGAVQPFVLGDLDRDGLKEVAIKVRTPSNTPTGAPSANVSLAILGQKTLDVAPTVPLGGTLSVRVANPVAAGKAFSVLASDAFDAEGGLRLGGWRTHLAPSPLLAHTLQAAPLSGVFDQDGLATVQVTIPSAPSWLGRTLYLKAVVRDTPTATEPYSMSTLGVVEVVP